MFKHILVTENGDKLSCGNEICDEIVANVTEAGLNTFRMIAVGGPAIRYESSPI